MVCYQMQQIYGGKDSLTVMKDDICLIAWEIKRLTKEPAFEIGNLKNLRVIPVVRYERTMPQTSFWVDPVNLAKYKPLNPGSRIRIPRSLF